MLMLLSVMISFCFNRFYSLVQLLKLVLSAFFPPSVVSLANMQCHSLDQVECVGGRTVACPKANFELKPCIAGHCIFKQFSGCVEI